MLLLGDNMGEVGAGFGESRPWYTFTKYDIIYMLTIPALILYTPLHQCP